MPVGKTLMCSFGVKIADLLVLKENLIMYDLLL